MALLLGTLGGFALGFVAGAVWAAVHRRPRGKQYATLDLSQRRAPMV